MHDELRQTCKPMSQSKTLHCIIISLYKQLRIQYKKLVQADIITILDEQYCNNQSIIPVVKPLHFLFPRNYLVPDWPPPPTNFNHHHETRPFGIRRFARSAGGTRLVETTPPESKQFIFDNLQYTHPNSPPRG